MSPFKINVFVMAICALVCLASAAGNVTVTAPTTTVAVGGGQATVTAPGTSVVATNKSAVVTAPATTVTVAGGQTTVTAPGTSVVATNKSAVVTAPGTTVTSSGAGTTVTAPAGTSVTTGQGQGTTVNFLGNAGLVQVPARGSGQPIVIDVPFFNGVIGGRRMASASDRLPRRMRA